MDDQLYHSTAGKRHSIRLILTSTPKAVRAGQNDRNHCKNSESPSSEP